MKKTEFLINLYNVDNEFKKLLKDFNKLENKYNKIMKKDKKLTKAINLEELSDTKNIAQQLYVEVVLPHFQHKNEEIISNGQEIITTVQGTYQNLKTKFHNFEINTNQAIADSKKNTQWYLPKAKINPISKPPRAKSHPQELGNFEPQAGASQITAPKLPPKPKLTNSQKNKIITINKQIKNSVEQEQQNLAIEDERNSI